jgi:hypothetical protein
MCGTLKNGGFFDFGMAVEDYHGGPPTVEISLALQLDGLLVF